MSKDARIKIRLTVACRCGGTLQPARRFEATRTVDVVCCFDCGTEIPPMLATSWTVPAAYCRWCGERFEADDPRQRYCSDDHRDRAGRVTLDRRHGARRIRRAG